MRPGNSIELTGLSVLVVEDEYFVASESERALRDHGARVLGPVPDVERAREWLAKESPDASFCWPTTSSVFLPVRPIFASTPATRAVLGAASTTTPSITLTASSPARSDSADTSAE